ncbi:MAG: glycosyltransferase family 2 protein [Candidatus Heimdallarchaeaceae archaeon]
MKEHKKVSLSSLCWKIAGVFLFFFTLAFAVIGIFYIGWSLFLIFNQFSLFSFSWKLVLQTVLNFMTLLLESLGIFYTIMLFYHMATTCIYPLKEEGINISILHNYPDVTILIPIYRVIPEVLNQTLSSLKSVNYPKEKLRVIFGDDTDPSYAEYEKILKIIQRNGYEYFYSNSNKKFKAGIINEMLPDVTSEFVVLLDHDHIIAPDFIRKSVSILKNNPQYAYVQSKVNFRNTSSKLQLWESVMYAQFFEIFARSKNKRSTVIFNGSTACFRKSALDEINGVPTYSFTEDVALTVELLSNGYKTTLLDEYGSFGLVPAKFSILLSQILRWAKGQFQVLRRSWKKITKSKLPILDRIDLIFSISLFLVASSMYVTSFFYLTMFFSQVDVIRAPMSDFLPLMIIPVAFSLSYYLSGIISVLLGRESEMLNFKLVDLVSFYLYALVLNPFTVYAIFKSFFISHEPIRGRDEWNESVPIFSISLIVSLAGLGMLICAIVDFLQNQFSGSFWAVLGLIGLSMIFTFPVSLYLNAKTKENNVYLTASNIQ